MNQDEMCRRMERGWDSGQPETACGRGSTLKSTEGIRGWLPKLVLRYGISTVCDAGAGDLGWMDSFCWDVSYRAFDLVPRHPSVKKLDITTEQLPDCDLILCRAVLNHLDEVRVSAAISLFREAGYYLLATQYPGASSDRYADWTPYDLREFGLHEPLESRTDIPGTLALWRL